MSAHVPSQTKGFLNGILNDINSVSTRTILTIVFKPVDVCDGPNFTPSTFAKASVKLSQHFFSFFYTGIYKNNYMF